MSSKFKHGDLVKVRDDLKCRAYGSYNAVPGMLDKAGHHFRIDTVGGYGYRLLGQPYWWTDEMLRLPSATPRLMFSDYNHSDSAPVMLIMPELYMWDIFAEAWEAQTGMCPDVASVSRDYFTRTPEGEVLKDKTLYPGFYLYPSEDRYPRKLPSLRIGHAREKDLSRHLMFTDFDWSGYGGAQDRLESVETEMDLFLKELGVLP